MFCPTNILFLSFLFLTEIRNESQRKSADTWSKEELRIKGPGGWHSSAVEQCEIGCCNQELHCGCLVVHNASGKYGGKKKRKQLQRHLYISPAAKGRMKSAFVQWRQRCCKHWGCFCAYLNLLHFFFLFSFFFLIPQMTLIQIRTGFCRKERFVSTLHYTSTRCLIYGAGHLFLYAEVWARLHACTLTPLPHPPTTIPISLTSSHFLGTERRNIIGTRIHARENSKNADVV